MHTLTPRKVDPQSWKSWLKRSADLLLRNPIGWSCYAVACSYLYAASPNLVGDRILALFLLPIGVVLACYSDTRQLHFLSDMLGLIRNNGRLLFQLGIAWSLFHLLMNALIYAVFTPFEWLFNYLFASQSPVQSAPDLIPLPWIIEGSTDWVFLSVELMIIFSVTALFFVIPLAARHPLDAVHALSLSKRAAVLNKDALRNMNVPVMLSFLLVIIVPVLGFMLWSTLMICLFYVAYRDVFLSVSDNEPEHVPTLAPTQ